MATAQNRYLEAFQQFSSGTTNRKERAREFTMDRLTRLFDEHMDDRDQSMALVNLGASIAAAPGALKEIKTGVTKLGQKLSDIRSGSRAASASTEAGSELTTLSGSGTADAAAAPVTTISSRAPAVFRAPTRPVAISDGEFGAPSIGAESASAGQTAEAAGEAAASGARSLIANTGRIAARAGANILDAAGSAGEAIGSASRAAGQAISSASEAASNLASGAADAVGAGARAILGDAAVDAASATVAGASELLGPASLLVLLGVGIFDLFKAFDKPKIDTNPKVPVDSQKAAVVAPSFDSTLQQTSQAGAF